jgi:hypothetical protein
LAAAPHLSALAAVSEVTEAADISTVPWVVLAAALLATALLAIGALRERRRRVTVDAAMAARTA